MGVSFDAGSHFFKELRVFLLLLWLTQVARKLREEEAFYYPHNVDFRGRAYPMHPHLNHLGSDMCRGLLVFAQGKPLGPKGFFWMKVHLANLYGGAVGKMPFHKRVAFIDSQMEDVLDSAETPLAGSRWWLKAEDPFQALAACMDIRDAIASDNPETFVSFLPVHQVFVHLVMNISQF